jgi:hypothetical protein
MYGILTKYSDFFNQPVPKDPISLILDIPKDELITTICAINTRLKPIYNLSFDNSKETQIDSLRAILLDLNNPINSGFASPFIAKYLQLPSNQILFTRVSCLFAFQEIIAVNKFVSETPELYLPLQRINIFKYLLIVNERILQFNKLYSENDHKVLGYEFFEYFMFKEIPLNQYNYVANPINKFYKGHYLMKKLEDDTFFSFYILDYLIIKFGISNINEFFKYIIGQFFQSNDSNLKITYLKIKVENTEVISVLSELGIRNNSSLPDDNDLKVLDFLELKKSPVFDCGVNNGIHSFIIMDSTLFLEKIYALFINDFWFDYLKPKKICNRKDWGNFLGSVFFEPFVDEIFSNISERNKRVVYLNSDFLKFNLKGNGEVEYADFYFREKNRVLLIEAKSNYLPIVNGYKEVLNINDYEKINLNNFYKDFGLNQLAEKTIKEFNVYKNKIKDPELIKKGKVKLYPLLITNEPILSLGFSSFAFRNKFEEMLVNQGVTKDSESIRILPLSIINISELQDIEQTLCDRNQTIFNLFNIHFSNTDIKKIKTTFQVATPLSSIINRHISLNKRISYRVRSFNWLGFNKNK